jgi:hypothetical protein
MANVKAILHPVANGLALIVAVAAVTIWSARLEHRVERLEAAVGPPAAAPALGAAARPAVSTGAACATLAMRIAEALQKPGSNPETLHQLLRDAGCPAAAAAPK